MHPCHTTTRQPPTIEDTTADHEYDIAAINKVIADIETGFNANDPDLSVEHFTQNASAVNVAGLQVSGRDALRDANRRGLAGPLRDQYARYEVSTSSLSAPTWPSPTYTPQPPTRTASSSTSVTR